MGARRYDIRAYPKPRISLGWTIATVIFALAVLHAIHPSLAEGVVVVALIWAAALAVIRGWERSRRR